VVRDQIKHKFWISVEAAQQQNTKKRINSASLIRGLIKTDKPLLSRRQTIDKVGQLLGRGLVSEDNRQI